MRLDTLIELKFVQLYVFELIPLLKLDEQLPVEQFEVTVSQSTVPSPPLSILARNPPGAGHNGAAGGGGGQRGFKGGKNGKKGRTGAGS